MRAQIITRATWLVVLTLLLSRAQSAGAALYWNHGVRFNTISVCFVGDALTSRPDRVAQIRSYIKEFEYAANIDFNFLGTCPPPTPQPNGDDYYDGDIRVVIPSTSVNGSGLVPGKGCPMFRDANGNYTGENDGWGSWSNPPDDLPKHRSCRYNLKLGDDPWNATPYLNHTLHEFGHALGLGHEHQRSDVNVPNCTESGYGGSASNGFITPYDRESVMHYQFLSCGIAGNYGYSGLSAWDKLALHILYPEDDRVAEYIGTTVVRVNDTLRLQSAWKARGANMDFVARNFVWKLAGTTVSTTPDLIQTMSVPGTYPLQLTYTDFLGRTYSATGTVRVLAAADDIKQIAATNAALSVLFSIPGSTVYLPLITSP